MNHLKVIISGIKRLSSENEKSLSSIASLDYQQISNELELKKALQNCDVFWFRLNHKLTKSILENVRCKYIICAVTGLDHIHIETCLENKIQIISLKGESEFLKDVRATAEHTLGLLLTLIRKSKRAYTHTEDGKWNRYLFQGTELYKKKVGVLGLGRLGKIMADYYSVLGMDVYYYDTEFQKEYSKKYKFTNSIEDLLSIIDVLSIHLPYNEQTHFILNKDNLCLLKESAVIVNTARGGLINEKDLLELLRAGKIAGYATDVLWGEPNISDYPLVNYAKLNNNVVITPHIGGNTFESIEKTETFVLNKLINILK
jgi:D-3-phosphoglycerate dehydrogenase